MTDKSTLLQNMITRFINDRLGKKIKLSAALGVRRGLEEHLLPVLVANIEGPLPTHSYTKQQLLDIQAAAMNINDFCVLATAAYVKNQK